MQDDKPLTKLTRFSYVVKKSDLDEADVDQLKLELTVKPFKQGNYGKLAKNTEFNLFVETEESLGIPKYFGIEKFGEPQVNKLEEYEYPTFDMKYNGELRPQQKMIVEKVRKGFEEHRGGLLIAGCGIGKTNMAIWLACKYKLKTLFIVHKGFLMQQFVNRVQVFTNINTVGIIQQDRVETDHPFVVAMVHSLAGRDYPHELFKDFGMIIIDEVHHMAAKYFSNVFKKITARYMLGISAETQRNDKLFKIINWYMGPFLHIEPQKPNDMVVVKKFNYETSNSARNKVIINRYTKEPDRSTMVTNLVSIKKRNRFILKMIEELYEQDKHILCLSGRLKQIRVLYKLLEKNPLIKGNVGKYIGSMKDKDLDISATKQIILATFDLAQEGLNIPNLNVVMLCTPKSSIRQSVGRILRLEKYEYHPLVIDILDNNKIFKGQSNTRNRYYAEQKYNIQEYNISDYELEGHIMWNDSNRIKACLLEGPDPKKQIHYQRENYERVNLDEVDFDESSE
jgi:superfamily II DNA or RNA helicase